MKHWLLGGFVVGALFYGAAVVVHGGVRAERGCVLDGPYPIVNMPASRLEDFGLPVRSEHAGDRTSDEDQDPSAPPFRAWLVIALGIAFWGGLGFGAAALGTLAGRRLASRDASP